MNKIEELRNRKKRKNEFEEVEPSKKKKEHDPYLSKYPPSGNFDCITITNFDGEKFYLVLEEEKEINDKDDEKYKRFEKGSFYTKKNNVIPLEPMEEEELDPISYKIEDQLWVNKYSPKDFMELITNERANREIMKFIKEWKTHKKILLLTGAPGMGKTTLAHVIAKQAGYNPIEVNASDDRTGSKLEDKIMGCTQIQNVFGDRKDNLLIIDEIDGIAGNEASSAIKLLLKTTLTKPIICICNDQYTPALRSLRLASQVFVFYKNDFNRTRITERLKEICKKEHIEIGSSVINEIVNQSEGDIRACLNTLQFMNKKKGNVTNLIIEKDNQRTYFQIMESIFHDEKIKPVGDFEDKVLEGCFDNYPLLSSVFDLDLQKTVYCLNMMGFCDEIQRIIKLTQNYQLNGYMIEGIKAFHLYYKSPKKVKFEYPKKNYEIKTKMNKNKNIIHSFLSCVNPESRSFMENGNISTEFIPFFVPLLTPSFKNSSEERKKLSNIIELHIKYGIEYKSINSNGKSFYQLEPEIDSLLDYGKKENDLLSIRGELSKQIFNEKLKKNVSKQKKYVAPIQTTPGVFKIKFLFEEGHNNAIKRQAKIKDF